MCHKKNRKPFSEVLGAMYDRYPLFHSRLDTLECTNEAIIVAL